MFLSMLEAEKMQMNQFLLPLVANFVLRISSKTHFRYQQTSFYAEHASIVLWDVLPCLKSGVCVSILYSSIQCDRQRVGGGGVRGTEAVQRSAGFPQRHSHL